MVLNKFNLNFQNKRYEKEYELQTQQYLIKNNNVQGITLIVFSIIVAINLYFFMETKFFALIGLIPLIFEFLALYENNKDMHKARLYIFLAVFTHVILAGILSFSDLQIVFNEDFNYAFGTVNGLIVCVLSSGLHQWFLIEITKIVFIFINFASVIKQLGHNEAIFLIPIISILIFLSNIVSYYKEMQAKLQFYDQMVAKDTIQDLKNLLQSNIPQSIFVVSQKPKKQSTQQQQQQNIPQININYQGKENNSTNKTAKCNLTQSIKDTFNQQIKRNISASKNQVEDSNRMDSQVSIDCEDDLVINFQNKYFSEYQSRFKFSNDITSFLKQIKIPSGMQTNQGGQLPKISDFSNTNNFNSTPLKSAHASDNSILDVILQQIKMTTLEKAAKNDAQTRQRRQTIAQDKGFQLDDIKEFFNCQYKQNTNGQTLNKIYESKEKKPSVSKKKKKQQNNSNMMSEFRNFDRALSQISIKNFTISNSNPPNFAQINTEQASSHNQNTLNPNTIYNGMKRKLNSISPQVHQEGSIQESSKANQSEIRKKSKTVQPKLEKNKPNVNNLSLSKEQNKNNLFQSNIIQTKNKKTPQVSSLSQNNQVNLKQESNQIENQQQSQQTQGLGQNLSIYPNQTVEIQSFSQLYHQNNLSSYGKTQQKLTRINSAKVDVESIYNKQSRQSTTSQGIYQPNSIHKFDAHRLGNKTNSIAGQIQRNSLTNQVQSIHNINLNQTPKLGEKQSTNSSPLLHFDIQLVKCQWEENDAIMVIMNDISEKVMNLRLKESDKYKDEMLATVTHSLKTPLNSMISLINKLVKKDKKNGDLKIISQSSNMLLLMIMDILDYQYIKRKNFKLQIEAFDLIDVLKEIRQLHLTQADLKGIEIKIVNNISNADMSLVLQDMDRIKQILNNLIGNAIKFTKHGSVTITVNLEESSPIIDAAQNNLKNDQASVSSQNQNNPSANVFIQNQTASFSNNLQFNHQNQPLPNLQKNQPSNISNTHEGDAEKSIRLNNYQKIFQNNGVISIQVKDTGSGIEESLQKRLFKIFATHDHNNGTTKHGVGLGLTVCRKIAKLIGPKSFIKLESQIGKGSSFTFYIYQNLLTSPKQYSSSLKNQNNPITISSSQEPFSNIPSPMFPLHQNSSQAEREEIDLVPASSTLRNSHITLAAGGEQQTNIMNHNIHNSNGKNIMNPNESPVLKTEAIDTGITPRNQNSVQFRSSEGSMNQINKEDNMTQKSKRSTFKNMDQSKRKKSSKLFQGSQISLILDLKHPLPKQKQFQQQYLNSFLNFTPRSQINSSNQFSNSIALHHKATKRGSEPLNDSNQASSLKLIGNNRAISPHASSSNFILGNPKEREFANQLILHKQQNHYQDTNDYLMQSGEINDMILSESCNQTPSQLNKQISEPIANNKAPHTKPIIQTPKKSLFKIDSKIIINQQKGNLSSINNFHQLPQSSTNISIDRHLNQYASNNLINASNNHFYYHNEQNNKYDDNSHNDHNEDNGDFEENYKPHKNQESEHFDENQQNQSDKKLNVPKIDLDQFNQNQRKEVYIVDSSVTLPYWDQQISSNYKLPFSDNNQEEDSDVTSSSDNADYNNDHNNNNDDGEDEDDEDEDEDDNDNDDENNEIQHQINRSNNVEAVEEDDDESKEEDNINLEGLFLNTINALIVDDMPFNIIVLKSFFQNCKNIKFSQAFDGKEAFELYKQNKYDLIFMDLNMPIMDGYESISAIRQYEKQTNTKETIIFAVTAQDQIKDIQKCIDCGANGHIPKPVKLSILYSSLYQYFKRR